MTEVNVVLTLLAFGVGVSAVKTAQLSAGSETVVFAAETLALPVPPCKLHEEFPELDQNVADPASLFALSATRTSW